MVKQNPYGNILYQCESFVPNFNPCLVSLDNTFINLCAKYTITYQTLLHKEDRTDGTCLVATAILKKHIQIVIIPVYHCGTIQGNHGF